MTSLTTSEICYYYQDFIRNSIRERMFAQINQLKGEVRAILDTLDTDTAYEIQRSWRDDEKLVDEHFTSSTQKEALLLRLKKIQKLEKEWYEVDNGLTENAHKTWGDHVLHHSDTVDYDRCAPAWNK